MALGAVGLKTQIWNNNAKSILLLMGFPLLILIMLWGFFFGLALLDVHGVPYGSNPFSYGTEGVRRYWSVAFAITGAWFSIAWLFHQSIIEAATGAQPVSRREQPALYNLLENLCISRGLTMPKLCIMETDALNAFASGLSRNSYTITVTRGLLNALNDAELEAVLGHELTHITNRDVRLLIVSVIFVGMISFFAEITWRMLRSGARSSSRRNGRGGGAAGAILVGAVVLAIGYFFAILIRFALSRSREFMADAGAVELTRNPDAMISALNKISGRASMENVPAEVRQMFIENPPGMELLGMFATHPPIESRIAALVRMGGQDAVADVSTKKHGPWG